MEKKRYDQLQQAGGSPVGLFHRCDSLAETPPTCCRGCDSLAGIPTACCCIAAASRESRRPVAGGTTDSRQLRQSVAGAATTYLLMFLAVACLFSCSTTKNLPEGEVLYTGIKKIDVTHDDKTTAGEDALAEVEGALAYPPNNALLGSSSIRVPFPFGLWDYNAFVNKKGKVGEVNTSYPIIKIEVAQQGVVAALLEEASANYIELYDKEGNLIVSHKSLLSENGFPLSFSISNDGEKMMTSYLSIKEGSTENQVIFYNFSNVGKDEVDRVVGTFNQYGETIVPAVYFVSNEDAIAIGDNVLTIYKMKEKPTIRKEIKFDKEIQKVFYNEKYVGLHIKWKCIL